VKVSLNTTVKVRGESRAGLMWSVVQSSPAAEIGGPPVNLSGQVIGITLANAGSGHNISNYAMPVNQALAIARYLDLTARPAS
jgi:S1-C subfamily serine protease